VDYVAVVYQTVSNFGNAAHPALEARLQHLARLGLVDELRRQEPREFSDEEKHALCSPVSQVHLPPPPVLLRGGSPPLPLPTVPYTRLPTGDAQGLRLPKPGPPILVLYDISPASQQLGGRPSLASSLALSPI